MSSTFNRIRTFLTRSKNTPDVELLLDLLKKSPFYERSPPWWARLTWGLIAADLLVTSSMTELTWRKWTERADSSQTKSSPSDSQTEDATPLRPTWQRAGLCALHLTTGVGLASALLIGRSRIVRRLDIVTLPSAPSKRQLFVQGVHQSRNNGVLIPMRKTEISPGRDNTELILRVQGLRGHWWVGLTGAKIDGLPLDAQSAQNRFISMWNVRRSVPQSPVGRWTSGPVIKNA